MRTIHLACGILIAVLVMSLAASGLVVAAAGTPHISTDAPIEAGEQTTVAQVQEVTLQCTYDAHLPSGTVLSGYGTVFNMRISGQSASVTKAGEQSKVTFLSDHLIKF